ncbi:hypothetical protein ABZ646_34965 [Streptomyces sp. NPDC007162]|uniref:hypothetical protein n=1 Tax=Streptomyces sp. NPDC007162 TaxID=3156917 RepID=UPI0033F4D9A6
MTASITAAAAVLTATAASNRRRIIPTAARPAATIPGIASGAHHARNAISAAIHASVIKVMILAYCTCNAV